MKIRRLKFYYLFLFLFLFVSFAESRQTINFNRNWKFTKGNPANAMKTNFDDSSWEEIHVPHDWAIYGPFDSLGEGRTGKLPWRGEGWYRKEFALNRSDEGKRIYFLFDGIMAFPKVYVNGELAGLWDYGYNSFYLDVSEFVEFKKKNVIAIHVDTRQHGSRWYPGAGIYRKVQMIITDPVHVGIWGTYITTPDVRDTWADVRILTSINNYSSQSENVEIVTTIISPDGTELDSKSIEKTIATEKTFEFEQWFTLIRPHRWDVNNPNLYRAKTVVMKNGKICDTFLTNFGIRTFKFTADDGFHLNGRRLQVKGVNLHHDHGPLGAAFYTRAMERQLEIMMEMGCNSIRTSHNVCAPELLDLCDKMGLIVFDEVFDKWDNKADILPDTDFYEFGERNIKNFVIRDRNHPSIVIWSVGNEIRDIQQNLNGGLKKLHAMVGYVRKYDPTRPVTMVSDMVHTVKWRHFDYYDIHCWNYGQRYLPARLTDPSKSVIISESASTVSTRGFYELPLPEKKTDFTNSLQISSYDLHAPRWAEISDDDFMWQEQDRYICGEYVWTGFDYLGEPTPYTDYEVDNGKLTQQQVSRSSYFGIVDLCGIPKDRYYLYRSHWAPEKTTVHILPHWNWEGSEGKEIPVFVYTNGDCAELFLNGKSLGKRTKNPKSENSTERYRLMWHEVIYQPGELKAVAYKEGKEIGQAVVRTAGEPEYLTLTPDRIHIEATGDDLSYILVEVFDKNNNACPKADNLVRFNIDGPATIAGVGNGNPQSLEPFKANHRKLFFGKAMLILRSKKGEKGKINITATSDGLKRAKTSIVSK
ncbi:glycoside hydrolase family 2 protein [candidate division KSB1 bacterium]|nr:glycoside hydrolase family 2 protein [candidate division KSB1 bacterium]